MKSWRRLWFSCLRVVSVYLITSLVVSNTFGYGLRHASAATDPDADMFDAKISSALDQAEEDVATQDPNFTDEDGRSGLAGDDASTPSDLSAAELTQEASLLYRDTRDYLSAYEMVDHALHLEPGSSGALRMKRRIQNDLDAQMSSMLLPETGFTPPEGIVAYRAAMADNLITQKEAVEIALQSSILIKSLQKKIEGARRKLTEARRALFPTVGGEISVNGGVVAGDAYTGESFKLNVSQPVFYGGELVFTVKQAESNLATNIVKYEKERLDVIHQVGEAYRGLVNADYNLSYQSDLLKEAEIIWQRTKAAAERKVVPEITYLETEATYQQVIFVHETAESALESADLLFHQMLNLDANEPLPVDDNIGFEEIDIDLHDVLAQTRKSNKDIWIKENTAISSHYGLKVLEAKTMPRVDLRGSAGLLGEVPVDWATGPDVEKEHSILVNVAMPVGPHSTQYKFQRRFFGPTVLSLTGSEDYRHTWNVNLFDKLSDLTDYDVAKGDYLNALAELRKEINDQSLKARDAYYDYRKALLQMKSSTARIRHRERQVSILQTTVSMGESSVEELLNEMVSLAEDRYAYVTAISSAKSAISNLNRIIGIENYYGSES